MGKRTVIFTESQLDEICGNGFGSAYLDLIKTPDKSGYEDAVEITAGGNGPFGEYTKDPTTDKISKTLSKSSARGAMVYGKGSGYIKEMSKKDWERENIDEEGPNGYDKFNGRQFGDENGKWKPETVTVRNHRMNKAIEKATNGSTPEIRQSGLNTISNMKKNGGESFEKAQQQLATTRNLNQQIQDSKPEGEKIKSAPKTGVGTAHSDKNEGGFIIDV